MVTRFLKHIQLLLGCICLWLPQVGDAQGPAPADADADATLQLSRDVRQILSDNCYACHGFDAKQRQADLRLDTQDGASGVLDIKQPLKSELVQRILSEDDDVRMPPPDFHKALTKSQKQTIVSWVQAGAPWAEHWSFESLRPPVYRQAAPFAAATQQNWIDALVQAKLTAQGMRPAKQADMRRLIRRVTLDLTGLPPTTAQVEAVLADPHPLAYERYVDQLLQSPAYGERMAWDWLDAARYADTNGYQGDRERTMWPWRDWVVDAMNRGMPFDQFTVWQLAGDLLPDATTEQKLATGFCRNHMINGEGGRIPEENRVDYVMDMAETMGTVWLGLTLNCCRCHDHKFDPLKQQEYYQLFAFFNQTPVTGGGGDPQMKPVITVASPAQQRRENELQDQLARAQSMRIQREQQLAKTQPSWESEQREKMPPGDVWTTLRPVDVQADHQKLKVLNDDSVLAEGDPAPNDNYSFTAPAEGVVAAVRLEALQHKSLTEGTGLSRADSGNFVLTDFRLRVKDAAGSLSDPVEFASATATFEQGNLKADAAIDSDPKTGWAVYEGKVVNREHAAKFVLKEPLKLSDGAQLHLELKHESVHQRHNIGRFRLSVSKAATATLKSPVAWQQWLSIPVQQRTAQQKQAVAAAHRKSDPEHRQLSKQIENLNKQRSDLAKSFAKVMVMEELKTPRKTFILDRGLYNKPLTEVSSEVPAFLPPLPSVDDGADRMALAQWLVDDQHPLTARVTVNRIWNQLFGIGLVKTLEDFGVQGEIPKQLDLLDALAWEYQQSGWDTKRLLRTIVTSHTYRQSSKLTAESAATDPDNRWLARGPRFRLPSWMLRDQALAAAGLLVRRRGGPAVNTYQPAGVWEEATFGKKKYTQDHGAKLYRRSLYTFWRRIIGPTMFFDTASRQTCTVKSFRTNTPLHALLTLNGVTYVEAARVMAERVLAANALSDRQRLNLAMKRLLAREATDAEAAVFLPLATETMKHYQEDPEAAKSLLSIGEYTSRSSRELDPALHAAWTTVCLGLLNLDETLNKE